jgi:hypothetical protein
MGKWLRIFFMGAAVMGLVANAAPAWAQSCALCYTQAASGTQQFIQALRSGILILIVPPFLMWTATLVVIYRRRNRFRADEQSASSW